MIYDMTTKALLLTGVRNKLVHCVPLVLEKMSQIYHTSVIIIGQVALAAWKLIHIILERFWQSENMHGLKYHWLVGDGDSSLYHSVVTGVQSYGHDIIKVECTNQAVKCYQNWLETLCNDKPLYCGKYGLSQAMIKRITQGAWCAI